MTTKEIKVQRFSVTSSRSFGDVVAAFAASIGHPDMRTFVAELGAAKIFADVEKIARTATGPSDLMEFMRLNLGDVLRKRNGAQAGQSVRFILGNPVTMSKMVEHVPDAGSYAPVTVLIDERDGGVQLSYDRMASFLAPYGNPATLRVAEDLDARVEALLTAAAG